MENRKIRRIKIKVKNKKGSIFYGVMILILCSGLLVRQNRLITSHVYLEKGIYSMDIRIEGFKEKIIGLQDKLNETYETYDEFELKMTSSGKGDKKIKVDGFEITRDNTYNRYDVFMIKIKIIGETHFRYVTVENQEGKISLSVRGV